MHFSRLPHLPPSEPSLFRDGPCWTRIADYGVWLALPAMALMWFFLVMVNGIPSAPVPSPESVAPVLSDSPAIRALQALGVAAGLVVWAVWLLRCRRRHRRNSPESGMPSDPDAAGHDAVVLPFRDLFKLFAFTLACNAGGLWVIHAFLPRLREDDYLPVVLWLGVVAGPYGWLLWKRRGGGDGIRRGRTPEGGAASFGRSLGTAVTAFLGFFPVMVVLLWLTEGGEWQPITAWLAARRNHPDLPVALVVLYVSLIGPVVEEIQFRLVLRGVLRRWMTGWSACLVNGLFFGLIHGQLHYLPFLAAVGFYWSWWRERTHGLAVPILLHMMNNTYAMVVLWLALES